MGLAGWGPLGSESSNVAAAIAALTDTTTGFVVDIDNTGNTPGHVYLALWIEINMTAAVLTGGSITLFLRRKRGSDYAENNDGQLTIPVSSGTGLTRLSGIMQIPLRGIFGLYMRNNLGTSTPAGSSGIIGMFLSSFTEDVS